jgi:hypothetical protein
MRKLLWLLASVLISYGQSSRPFYLSATASQAVPNQTPLYQQNSGSFSLQALAADVDVVSIFPEHLGFPVDLFYTSQPPPSTHPWTIQVTSLAQAAKLTGKPIALQLALTRDYMVSKAYDSNGVLKLDRTWAPRCLDLSSPIGSWIGISYVNYVRWLTALFNPKYVVVMAEVNLYYTGCGGDTTQWRALVNIERNAYDAAKGVNSSVLAFPSFNIEGLYGNSLTGFDSAQYNAYANLKRDRFGISTYPSGLRGAGGEAISPYQLPVDYLSRVKDRYPQEGRILIAETGWNSNSISIQYQGSCFAQVVPSNSSFASAYLLFVLYRSFVNNFEMVTWWSDRDLIDGSVMTTCYPPVPPGSSACSGDLWCLSIAQFEAEYAPFWSATQSELAFKVFGAMGIRTYGGNPKPDLMNWWSYFLAVPVSPQ